MTFLPPSSPKSINKARAVTIIIVLSLALIGALVLINQQLLNPINRKISQYPTPAPTSKPLFSASLSPSTQTIVSDLNQFVNFKVTITGKPTYPCSITVHGGSSGFTLKYTVYDSGLWNTPDSSNGDSKTFTVSAPFESKSGERSYYVSVIDSLGNTVSSNKVQVIYR